MYTYPRAFAFFAAAALAIVLAETFAVTAGSQGDRSHLTLCLFHEQIKVRSYVLHNEHRYLSLLCTHIPEPLHSLQRLRWRLCLQKLLQ